MEVPLVKLIRRTSCVIEELATGIPGGLVGCTVENQQRQRDTRKFLLQPLVCAYHLGQRFGWLSLVGNQWVVVHYLHGLRVTREDFVLEVKYVRMRRDI